MKLTNFVIWFKFTYEANGTQERRVYATMRTRAIKNVHVRWRFSPDRLYAAQIQQQLRLTFPMNGMAKLEQISPPGNAPVPCWLPSLERDYHRLCEALLADDTLRCCFVHMLKLLAGIAYNYGPSYEQGVEWHRRTPTHFVLLSEGSRPHVINVIFNNGAIRMHDDTFHHWDDRVQPGAESHALWQLLCDHYEATAAIICGVMKNAPRWTGSPQQVAALAQ